MTEKKYMVNGHGNFIGIAENGEPLTEDFIQYYKDDVKLLCDLLNKQEDRINELESEKEFWKHNCISESNRNSILICELGFAQEQGYEWSDAFEKYENSVKENSEWNKRYLSENKKW